MPNNTTVGFIEDAAKVFYDNVEQSRFLEGVRTGKVYITHTWAQLSEDDKILIRSGVEMLAKVWNVA